MRVWIDATRQDDGLEIFGMSLLERLLRSLLEAQRQVDGLKDLEGNLPRLTEAAVFVRSFIENRLHPTEILSSMRRWR